MKIKIVYETQTGTTQYVSEIIRDELKAKGHEVDLHSVKYDGNDIKLDGYEAVLFGAPTYEDGKLETTMKVFTTRTKDLDLSKYKVAVFGLGSTAYPLFCKAADALESWVKERGGSLIVPLLRVDGFPDNTTPITDWTEQLATKL